MPGSSACDVTYIKFYMKIIIFIDRMKGAGEMFLTTQDIAKMMDLSCVQVTYTQYDLIELVNTAKKYGCGQISVLHCFLEDAKELAEESGGVRVVGNVSFPSGSDTTALKVVQAEQIKAVGVDEIDMVLNVNYMRSGMYDVVRKDIAAVAAAVGETPLKVIIEVSCLKTEQIKLASKMCVDEGAAFVKTGTGWTGPTTVGHVKTIKSVVGDAISIKASGGVKSLALLVDMYKEGATRFGVNLEGGIRILEECIAMGGKVEL